MLNRSNPLEYNSLPLDRSARRQRRKQHQRRSMVDLPEFGNGARFKPQGSSSSSEDVRAASEDRLLEARLEGRSGPKRSSVGGRRRMREEQRRREKEGNSRESPATRVSAQVVSILESILAPPVGDSAHGCNSFPALKRAPFCPRVTVRVESNPISPN